MLTFCFAAVSLLYATVGQAGGTAFLALMAFASFPSNEMRPTALLLNIVAATYSTWLFNRGHHIDWTKLKPLLIASLPTALVGGVTILAERSAAGLQHDRVCNVLRGLTSIVVNQFLEHRQALVQCQRPHLIATAAVSRRR